MVSDTIFRSDQEFPAEKKSETGLQMAYGQTTQAWRFEQALKAQVPRVYQC